MTVDGILPLLGLVEVLEVVVGDWDDVGSVVVVGFGSVRASTQ